MTAHDDPAARPGPSSHEHAADDPYCVDAIRSLYLYLDRELGPEEIASVEAHLHECSPCFEAYDFEAEFRSVIATRGHAPMPPEVRTRLERLLSDLGAPASWGGLPGGLPGELPGAGGPVA